RRSSIGVPGGSDAGLRRGGTVSFCGMGGAPGARIQHREVVALEIAGVAIQLELEPDLWRRCEDQLGGFAHPGAGLVLRLREGPAMGVSSALPRLSWLTARRRITCAGSFELEVDLDAGSGSITF